MLLLVAKEWLALFDTAVFLALDTVVGYLLAGLLLQVLRADPVLVGRCGAGTKHITRSWRLIR